MCVRGLLLILAVITGSTADLLAQNLVVPRRHERPPGPAVSPQEAAQKMTVPEGFSVEVVASEPDVVNPVAMTIDEKGRFWVTESFEYPRREPGPGRDRIKVLEDTDGDGKVDKVTVFAEGLNIPSGIAVGHGGVWVVNAPDLLFLQDTDGDGKADKQQILMTGFGRTDTHELPNSLTWGPDGWLYGLNGVFNYCSVTYGKDSPHYKPDEKPLDFTCVLFRIHPRTKKFEIFAEGTSNPWGIAINEMGDFFVSACVIDHFWHLADNAYYIRQGGPYPPHTWPLGSIVKHTHQKAAYCGITYFDSEAYPAEYSNTFYMGNIHGGCLNADVIKPNGSSYLGRPHAGFTPKAGAWDHDQYGEIRKQGDEKNPKLADLLNANDPWFMPVVQKVGPDGCLYILDWYDRYHCYQDANADPAGVDRAHGRLYRLRYRETPRAKSFDMTKLSDQELIRELDNSNIFVRDIAQRLLAERNTPEIRAALLKLISNPNALVTRQIRHATFALLGCDLTADREWLQVARALAGCKDQFRRVWAMRCLRNYGLSSDLPEEVHSVISSLVLPELVQTEMRPVQLAAITFVARSLQNGSPKVNYLTPLSQALASSANDPLIPNAIWQALKSLSDQPGSASNMDSLVLTPGILEAPGGQEVIRRLLSRTADQRRFDVTASLLKGLVKVSGNGHAIADQVIRQLSADVASGALRGKDRDKLKEALSPILVDIQSNSDSANLVPGSVQLAAAWGDRAAVSKILNEFESGTSGSHALDYLRSLISSGDPSAFPWSVSMLRNPAHQEQVLFLMGRLNQPEIAGEVLKQYPKLDPGLQPRALELLTQRPQWAGPLLTAIAAKSIEKDALNLNQLKRVASFKDDALKAQFTELYGTIREGRNPDREHVINQMRDFLGGTPGDPHQGQLVFNKVCAQCHKIYGEGAEVGPDITLNGRNNWVQLLSNVLDPSLVIGKDYQARIIATADGRILTGLPVEETDTQVILKIQGGKLETIPRSEIDDYRISEQSMMPEQLEKQLTPQELADLFAFLALDKPPTDPTARVLNGAPAQKVRK